MDTPTLLRQLMKAAGLTQKELAQALGVKQQVVASWIAEQDATHNRPVPPLQALKMQKLYGWDAFALNPKVADFQKQLEALGHAPPSADNTP